MCLIIINPFRYFSNYSENMIFNHFTLHFSFEFFPQDGWLEGGLYAYYGRDRLLFHRR